MLMLRHLTQHSGPHGTCASGKCGADCGNITNNRRAKMLLSESTDGKVYSVTRYGYTSSELLD